MADLTRLVSIVIPLHNRIDLTAGCLGALNDTAQGVRVVLVDNGSTDLTRKMSVEVRNAHNRGFANACNQGADQVRTPYVVFLNNDTMAKPGWLAALMDTLTSDGNVGVAGGLLTYPGGAVQHAGVSVDFTRPPGLEARNLKVDLGIGPYDVDAITGACLAMRLNLFYEVGGFDAGFWNGYEDIDLCLKVRSKGYVCRYTPDCKVEHWESQSGPERWTHVRENINRLRERWS